MKALTRSEELKARHKKERAEFEAKEQIESALLACLPLPTISNIRHDGKVRAWLSFSPAYGQDAKTFALGIFEAMEREGAKPQPVSLCQYGTWRRSVYVGTCDDQPDKRRHDELKDVEPIAPLWVVPCQFTGVETLAFYEIGGHIYRVCVEAPLQARLSCRKVENFGGWRFDGACTVCFPDKWHSLHTASGESVAHISQHTRGYRDTEQGITGVIYFQPLTEQTEFPLTPAQMLAQLF